MSDQDIRSIIAHACSNERLTGRLRAKMVRVAAGVHHSIALPAGEDGADTLVQFVTAYVEHVPRLLDALCEAAEQAGMVREVAPIVNIIEDFFLQASPVPAEHRTLEELLDEAYLAHRLVEEVNDRYLMLAGSALVTLDMTTANLIMHSLIGEPFANELDEVAQEASSAIISPRLSHSEVSRSRTAQRLVKWTEAWQHWSDVYQVKDLGLRFIAN